MNREDIILMAQEAGVLDFTDAHCSATPKMVLHFAALVAAHYEQQLKDARTEAVALRVNEQNLIAALEAEREAIAQFFEQHYRDRWTDVEIVEAIRARSTT